VPVVHAKDLQMYWIDVEGGAATLIVAPGGQSLLIDTGWADGDRDAKRIVAAAQAAVSIAPDGLESFARDLRAMRAKAELDYPEMAETSHYTMKTLVSAAGGLRLPTLPVAVAYVRACDGNVADWEERWQKLATKITADAVKKRRGDGEELLALPEPADQPALPEPSAPVAAQESPAESGEVYVITSAKPRQPGW